MDEVKDSKLNKKATEFVEAKTFERKNLFYAIPREVRPTSFTSGMFLLILGIVIIIGIMDFPINALIAGKTDQMVLNIGWPWTFIELNIATLEGSPVKVGPLLGTLAFYLIISYVLNIVWNVLSGALHFRNVKKENLGERPSEYKIKKEE